jgi:hypothetical protein
MSRKRFNSIEYTESNPHTSLEQAFNASVGDRINQLLDKGETILGYETLEPPEGDGEDEWVDIEEVQEPTHDGLKVVVRDGTIVTVRRLRIGGLSGEVVVCQVRGS